MIFVLCILAVFIDLTLANTQAHINDRVPQAHHMVNDYPRSNYIGSTSYYTITHASHYHRCVLAACYWSSTNGKQMETGERGDCKVGWSDYWGKAGLNGRSWWVSFTNNRPSWAPRDSRLEAVINCYTKFYNW